MNTIHTIKKITLSGPICPNCFDVQVSMTDPIIESRMITYFSNPNNGGIERLELSYRWTDCVAHAPRA